MDNRREPRVPNNIRFFVHVNDCPEDPDLVGVSVACEGVDFSTHGLRFRAERELPTGSTINITIGIGEPFAMFLLCGEIRWVRPVNGSCFMGILLRAQEGTDHQKWCDQFDEIFS